MNIFSGGLFSIVTLPLLVASLGSAQVVTKIEVDDPRPLMKMIDELEALAGVPINYEDRRFEHLDDVQDITDQVARTPAQRAASPAARFIVPKGGKLSLDSPLLADGVDASDIPSLLTQIRVAYEGKNLPGRFVWVKRNATWYVEPGAVRARSGDLNSAGPVMGVRISISARKRTAWECLKLILSQVAQKNGTHIGVGALPMVAFANATVTLGADDEPAAVVMARLFSELSPRIGESGQREPVFSYRLLFDPKLKYYGFNIRSVRLNPPAAISGETPTVLPGDGKNAPATKGMRRVIK